MVQLEKEWIDFETTFYVGATLVVALGGMERFFVESVNDAVACERTTT